MLEMGGNYDESVEPIRVIWQDPLPSNEKEEIEALSKDVEIGLVSKQTASQKRGYDWSTEQGRIEQEQADEDNIGALILRNFETNRGV
jgi:hypothetical protein